MEQEEYKREEINWSYIEFIDNQDVLDLIEKVLFFLLFVFIQLWASEQKPTPYLSAPRIFYVLFNLIWFILFLLFIIITLFRWIESIDIMRQNKLVSLLIKIWYYCEVVIM